MYLCFVLLLEHFSLLSQYHRPLGSWSALLVSSFLLVTTRLARQRGVTFSLDRCFLFFLQLSLSFFLFLLSFLFFIFFLLWTSSRLFWMGGDLVGDTWQLPMRLPFHKTARLRLFANRCSHFNSGIIRKNEFLNETRCIQFIWWKQEQKACEDLRQQKYFVRFSGKEMGEIFTAKKGSLSKSPPSCLNQQGTLKFDIY